MLVLGSVAVGPEAAASDIQSKQWYLKAMGAEEMWKYSTGKGVKVAVIDSGINPNTPSLKGQVLADEVPKSVAYHVTQDYAGHGTDMAELIAGTGAGGEIKGLAPGAKVVPYRIYGEGLKDPKEKERTPSATAAIKAAADSDVKIINMSFASPYYSLDEEEAIKYAASKGKLLFAGIGNTGDKGNKGQYPAQYPYAVGVSAINEDGEVGKFSTHGNYVDFAAPGVGIPSWCDNTFTKRCIAYGTSPATALASASAALIWSAHPDWTANQVLRSLIDTAARTWPKDKPGTYLGYGVVRPRRVLINKNIDPGPANVDPLAKENGTADGEGEDAKGTSTPTPSPKPSAGDKADGQTSAAAKTTDSGDHTRTWVTIGAAAAVLLIAGAGFAVLRARRNA
ncbi:S8 family serine peptidase [Streptomyces sp. SID4985]|uniref:S8 family serine peptidase n=1 Tax=Streptomyces sp. SID4985 TaxID=2690292 RepID=UPI0013693BD2|nr:S8 family serine peptidase [Streptomyces sp. SID4985]MYQ45505.1 S8 family serine peptidase [Streptomyces sp. SID4985]